METTHGEARVYITAYNVFITAVSLYDMIYFTPGSIHDPINLRLFHFVSCCNIHIFFSRQIGIFAFLLHFLLHARTSFYLLPRRLSVSHLGFQPDVLWCVSCLADVR